MKRAIAWRTKRAQCKQIKLILICRRRITDDYGESMYHTFAGKICRENKGNTITPENVCRPNAHEGVYPPEAYRDMNSRGAALRFPALLNARAYSGSSWTSLFTNRANKSLPRVLSLSLSLSCFLGNHENRAFINAPWSNVARSSPDSRCWRLHPYPIMPSTREHAFSFTDLYLWIPSRLTLVRISSLAINTCAVAIENKHRDCDAPSRRVAINRLSLLIIITCKLV
jgi:hypothetical protein